MFRELLSVLTSTYNEASIKPLATYKIGTATYIIYAVKSFTDANNNLISGYPVLKINEFLTDQTRFDQGTLITTEDVKSGSATLFTQLTTLAVS